MPGPLPRLLLLLVLLPAAGCGAEPPAAANTAPPAAIATAFDPGKCGRLAGRVTWNGPLPEAPTFIFGMPKKDGSFDVRLMPNPNRPQIDPDSRSSASLASRSRAEAAQPVWGPRRPSSRRPAGAAVRRQSGWRRAKRAADS